MIFALIQVKYDQKANGRLRWSQLLPRSLRCRMGQSSQDARDERILKPTFNVNAPRPDYAIGERMIRALSYASDTITP